MSFTGGASPVDSPIIIIIIIIHLDNSPLYCRTTLKDYNNTWQFASCANSKQKESRHNNNNNNNINSYLH